MALTKGLVSFGGACFCLLIDPEADSIEVVHADGFTADGHAFHFPASYYEERPVQGDWGSVMVRRLEEPDAAVGLMVEHVSLRFPPRRLWRRPRGPTIPQVIEMLLILAHDNLGVEADPIFDEPRDPLSLWHAALPELKVNGGGVLHR